jgi:hypothetical protein
LTSDFWWVPYIPIIVFIILLISDRDRHTRSIVRYGIALSISTFMSFLILHATNPTFITPIIMTVFFVIGYYSPWSGLFWREITILQNSIEGKMIKQHNYPALTLRLIKSMFFRIGQVVFMIVWVILFMIMRGIPLDSLILWIFPSLLILMAIALALVEHYYLWIDTSLKSTNNVL